MYGPNRSKWCADLDSQADGIASIRKRPREAALAFAIEAYHQHQTDRNLNASVWDGRGP